MMDLIVGYRNIWQNTQIFSSDREHRLDSGLGPARPIERVGFIAHLRWRLAIEGG